MAQSKSRGKPFRVLGGMLMMLGSVAVALAILTRFAGNWGVPYFAFATDRGSVCVNNWIGYSCDRLTLADLNWWADTGLPAGTKVHSARYVSTHDYSLDATVEVPAKQAPAALSALQRSFGSCVDNQVPPMKTAGLSGVCVMADQASDAESSDPDKSSRLYSVGTGLRSSGVRLIVLSVRSR